MRRVLGHISGSTTVLTTQCQALQQAQADQDDGSGHANAGVVREQAHDERGNTHDQNGHQEGVLAANHVAQTAKENGAERTDNETSSKSQQRKIVGRTFILTAEELFRNDCGE